MKTLKIYLCKMHCCFLPYFAMKCSLRNILLTYENAAILYQLVVCLLLNFNYNYFKK